MLGWLYEQIWSRWPGRPWTYVVREWAEEHPMGVFLSGMVIGVLLGHFWWDTRGRYIKRQEDFRGGRG